MACLLKVILNKKKFVLFENPLDLPIIIFSFVVIGSFLSTVITHYPLDFFYKEKVLSVLKRMLFIRNPYDYSYIFTSTFTILEGVLLFFLVSIFVREERVLKRTYFLLILGWGIAIILGFVQYFGGILGYERWPTRMFSTFDNPNLFGGYLILTFPIAVLYGVNKPFLKSISLWILTLLSILALILSRSKTSWIAFTVLLAFMAIFSSIFYVKKWDYKSSLRILNWKWISVSAICFVIIFGPFYIYLKRGEVLKLLSDDANWRIPIEQKLDIRLPLWKHTIQMVEDFPLWGVGIGEFNFALPKYSYDNIWSIGGHFHPHNYFLHIAAELGLIGLYAFLWILWKIFIKGLQIAKGTQNFIKIGLWFGIIGFVFTFFGDGYLWNIEMQLMFWLFIGLLFVNDTENERTYSHEKSHDKKLFFALSIILLLTLPLQIYHRSQISFLSERSMGLYQEKFKDEGGEYQWGEKVVMIPLEVKGKWINIPIRFGNPDIKEHPVKAKIFVNRRIIDHLDFRDNDWHTLRYPIQNMEGSELFLKIEVSRTWNPYLMGVKHETRDLGPALGKIFWSS
jgi:putative inorganic carbon (HCO3(-)) transporter